MMAQPHRDIVRLWHQYERGVSKIVFMETQLNDRSFDLYQYALALCDRLGRVPGHRLPIDVRYGESSWQMPLTGPFLLDQGPAIINAYIRAKLHEVQQEQRAEVVGTLLRGAV